MIRIRPAAARGHADYGWLDTWHTFSFADYHDPAEMGWGSLRVINDDTVAPARGFGRHGHRDMEIVSVVLAGALEHQDSLGNGTVIRPGEVQRMSAGKGVLHSEFNPSADQPAHFLQIWIVPAAPGGSPSYEQKSFPAASRRGVLRLLASPDGADGSVTVGQDARLWVSVLAPGERVEHRPAPGRLAYLHVIGGAVAVNGVRLGAADGARIADEAQLEIVAAADVDSEFLLFDLAPL